MIDFLAVVLLLMAFIVLMGTFLVISILHRAKLPRLPSMEKGEPGDPFRLRFNSPIMNWLAEQEVRMQAALPGYFHPIGVVYGILAAATACALLFLTHFVASILGLLVGFLGVAYSLEGISQALLRKDFLRIPIAAAGLVLGISVIVLHGATFFGRRLLPAWSL